MNDDSGAGRARTRQPRLHPGQARTRQPRLHPGRALPRTARSMQRRRAGMLAPALSGLALLAAACGSSPGAGTSSGPSGPPVQQLVAFSECMRTHGVPNFPDPTVSRHFVGFNPSGINTKSHQFQAAQAACNHFLPYGGSPQRAAAALLKYSVCMRAHGITNFPDPQVNSHNVGLNLHGIDTNSPQFLQAKQACKQYQPFGGGP